MTKLALAVAVVLAALLPAQGLAAGDRTTRSLPAKGVLVPGKSLAGVRLGDGKARVTELWGTTHTVCDWCRSETWFFTYEEPYALGAAVTFVNERAVAVFTLGAPAGWRSTDGLKLGEYSDRIAQLYPQLRWRTCIGYQAVSRRSANGVVTSIYSDGQTVYGFALTHPSQPVCQ
jgi:hypothetical protein